MAASLKTGKLIARLRNRGRTEAARAYFSLRRRLTGHAFWVDHGCIQLPYHGDGDLQELYYHLNGKAWWAHEMQLISPYLSQGGVAVDVGANLGFLSGILSGLAGPAGQVHSFEPSPAVYAKLLEVIAANRYTNVSAYNTGCGKEESTMVLYCTASSGNATLRPNAGMEAAAKNQQSVRIVKLDDFLGPKLERLDFLKIDTEGYEDAVLEGATELLKRFKPVLYIELCSQYLKSSERAVRILRDHGYTFDREPDLETSANGENYFALPPGR
jgi:FkbM family methyltransferase